MNILKNKLFLAAAITCVLLSGCRNKSTPSVNDSTVPPTSHSVTDVQETESVIPTISESSTASVPDQTETNDPQSITTEESSYTIPDSTDAASNHIQADINFGNPGADD